MDALTPMVPPCGGAGAGTAAPDLEKRLKSILESAIALTGAVNGVLSYSVKGWGGISQVIAGPDREQRNGFQPIDGPLLDVPLLADDDVLGSIQLTRTAGATLFGAGDEALVIELAAVAGIAIQNGRLLDQVTTRERWLDAANRLTATLLGAVPSSNPFTMLADHAVTAADASCAVTLIGAERDGAFPASLHDGSPTLQQIGTPLLTKLCQNLPLSVVQLDQELVEATTLPSGPALAAELRGRDRAFGVLVLVRQPGDDLFSALEVEMVGHFATHAAVAIEHLRAQQTAQTRAVHQDRKRIASNLHDIVIQHLFGTGLQLQALSSTIEPATTARELVSFVDQIDDTIRDIRRSIFALNQPVDDGIGLRSTILNVVTATPFSFEPRVSFNGPVDSAIPGRIHHDIVASLGEALSNIIRHARAHCVDVTISVDLVQRLVMLTVHDDGVGWGGPAVAGSGTGNLADRARILGGAFRVALAAGGGTDIEWTVPLGTPNVSANDGDTASGD